jgi:type VI secretion system protein ImpE
MVPTGAAEDSLRKGDLVTALKQLQEQIRARPADAKLRIFLFQMLAAMGQWERGLDQLNMAAQLDPGALAMAQMYREALRCELLRAQVFAGKHSPMVLGEPERWLALLIESTRLAGRGQAAQAAVLRASAFDSAPTTAGSVDGVAFEWIADADTRLGPVVEAVLNGRYYWIPFSHIRRIEIEKPEDLRDLVWLPAHFEFANAGEVVGVIPTRYPGSEMSEDSAVCLARKTVWQELPGEEFHGLGQRLIATDQGEYPIMDVRSILLTPIEPAAAGMAEATGG